MPPNTDTTRPDSTLSVIQLTDLHLLADPQAEFKGQYPWHNLVRIIERIGQNGWPDLFLLTGDLSQDESEASYRMLFDLMQSTGTSWYWLPGNHDDTTLMEQLHPIHQSVTLGRWQWLLLDSQSGSPHGELNTEQQQWLQQQLATPQASWQAIALHHQPLLVGPDRQGKLHQTSMDDDESIGGIDSIPLRDQGWLWQTLSQYTQVRGVICGHVHQAHTICHQGLTLYTSPATSIQFTSDINEFQLDSELNPGYRQLYLTADGRIESHVCRLS